MRQKSEINLKTNCSTSQALSDIEEVHSGNEMSRVDLVEKVKEVDWWVVLWYDCVVQPRKGYTRSNADALSHRPDPAETNGAPMSSIDSRSPKKISREVHNGSGNTRGCSTSTYKPIAKEMTPLTKAGRRIWLEWLKLTPEDEVLMYQCVQSPKCSVVPDSLVQPVLHELHTQPGHVG